MGVGSQSGEAWLFGGQQKAAGSDSQQTTNVLVPPLVWHFTPGCFEGYRPGNTVAACPLASTGQHCALGPLCSLGYHLENTHVCLLNGSLSGGACQPTLCNEGLRLNHSATVCEGATGEICDFGCEPGHIAMGVHQCDPTAVFAGGRCAAEPCRQGTTLQHSATVCGGATADTCTYTCDRGYEATGIHRCGADATFAGGSCDPGTCTQGGIIPDSLTVCEGRTGDVCAFACGSGYSSNRVNHTCEEDGAWRGGLCTPNQCHAGLRLANSTTVCSGRTASACSHACEMGFTVDGRHVCGTDGVFRGGSCQPNECREGLILNNSVLRCLELYNESSGSDWSGSYLSSDSGSSSGSGSRSSSGGSWYGETADQWTPPRCTTCRGATGDLCSYTCMPGHVAMGAHRCGITATFVGGLCAPIRDCWDGLTLEHSSSVCAGVTAEICAFICDRGYEPIGIHQCVESGTFIGGACELIPTASWSSWSISSSDSDSSSWSSSGSGMDSSSGSLADVEDSGSRGSGSGSYESDSWVGSSSGSLADVEDSGSGSSRAARDFDILVHQARYLF